MTQDYETEIICNNGSRGILRVRFGGLKEIAYLCTRLQ